MFKLISVVVVSVILITNSYAEKVLSVEEIKIPNSLKLLPEPPTANSIGFLNDKAISESALKGRKDSERYEQAIIDTGYSANSLAKNFSKSFGYNISKENTPIIYSLIDLAIKVSSKATADAKKEHKRIRPFVYYNKQTCNPAEEKHLGKFASYPSGHTTEGWAIALILAEINPNHQEQILKKGYEFGQSRVVCGAHWPSDVEAGYIVGSTVFSALNANDQFTQLIIQAKKEISSK
ncbi:acid phosphatase [Francisella adeliensis]|uniref:Acid phosphatase n=1 Tax=Francisella adeliensis TaxID=2007306 RepID=A0A2Z4XX80_9GAMM|nr:phosphatase PAP2 family protein [Francisella adeliensis]AXA33497.1 hypothetical protein CDH04_03295 [Francisella adeliensis]MBK2084805.1 phosphatase PAP2 family protein [Francisella adeliensis]MBK2097252.1 phosphatase PAP2 family protein [Francisella adeliensis]QIW11728.1 phosphatase PAP2 family protein [Francisella adeliensis]QIW13602.1 phosphatase PAP2 family protein [Francisella adeliensis]